MGARDADASLSVSAVAAARFAMAGIDTDLAWVWEQPHCEADYPGEAAAWIDALVRG